MKKKCTVLLVLFLLFNSLYSYAGNEELDLDKVRSEKWGTVTLKAHLLMTNGDIEEISFGGISADCDGYKKAGGLGIFEGGVESIVKWKDLKYFVPSAGTGKGTDGKIFNGRPLTLNICNGAYLYGTKPKNVKVRISKSDMWVDEEFKLPINKIKLFAFSQDWMSEGTKASKSLVTEDMVFLPGGCFQMGDVFDVGDGDERPVHEVCVDGFYIGRYELTQAEWWAVMGGHPSYKFRGCYNCPVESVNYSDVQTFIQKINDIKGQNYRLPTEAEWEYAARSGGKNTKWAGTSAESKLVAYAWYAGNNCRNVGEKSPNELKIYDMSGNVWEWVSDWYGTDYYKKSPKDNPRGPLLGSYRVLRGGGFFYEPRYVRTTVRLGIGPDMRNRAIGFRLAKTP